MKYAASVGSSATSGTTMGIQRINVVSSPVSERLLSVVDMIVGGLGSQSVAMNGTTP
jgi:hypothetical protein